MATKKARAEGKADVPPPSLISPGLHELVDYTEPDNRDWTAASARAVGLRILGYSIKDIAHELMVSQHAVRQWLTDARKRAELMDVAPLLDNVALPLAIDNLIDGLQNGDKKLTLATLKGRGAFTTHSKSENTNTNMQLEIHVEMPSREGASLDVVEGQVVGIPRQLGGSVDA